MSIPRFRRANLGLALIFSFLVMTLLPLGKASVAIADSGDVYTRPPAEIVTARDGQTFQLNAIAPPVGASDRKRPVFCIDSSTLAPGVNHEVVSVSTLTESKKWGPAELDLSTAQIAIALNNHQLSRDSVVVAALAYLVHANLEDLSEPVSYTNSANSQELVNWLVAATKYSRPDIHNKAVEIAKEARDSAVASYGKSAATSTTDRSGTISEIGVTNEDGQWIADANVTVTLSGPAVFHENGRTTWSGKTDTKPISLTWQATGNGEVTFSVEYTVIETSIEVLYDPIKQDTVQFPHSKSKVIERKGNTWWVDYNFQPMGESFINKFSDSADFTDTLSVFADPEYGSGNWLKVDDEFVPVTFTAELYHLGDQPVERSAQIPPGQTPLSIIDVEATGPGDITAGFNVDDPGFYTVVWRVDPAKQDKEFADYLAGSWSDDFAIPEETVSYRHFIDVDTSASVRETKRGTYIVDDVWVRGFPSNHTSFADRKSVV